jgi:hypothetical protein
MHEKQAVKASTESKYLKQILKASSKISQKVRGTLVGFCRLALVREQTTCNQVPCMVHARYAANCTTDRKKAHAHD